MAEFPYKCHYIFPLATFLNFQLLKLIKCNIYKLCLLMIIMHDVNDAKGQVPGFTL